MIQEIDKDKLNLPYKFDWLKSIWDPTVEYYKRLKFNEFKTEFKLMFGPPFTSGKPHLGTIYSEIIKDILSSSLHVAGYKVLLQPGFDAHGLPTENLVLKEKNENQNDLRSFYKKCLLTSFRNLCQQVKIYKSFKIIASWDNPYYTSSLSYINSTIKNLKAITLKGFISLQYKEIDYCVKTQSIVPLSELEKREEIIETMFVTFPIPKSENFILIWTSTPWSLKANVSIAFNSKLKYNKYLWNSINIISRDGSEKILDNLKIIEKDIKLPSNYFNLYNEKKNLIEAEWVEDDFTGFVHIAGLYDKRDFNLSKKHGLPLKNIHNEIKNLNQANEEIKILLKEKNSIFLIYNIKKMVNFYTRSNSESIRLVSKQFFIDTTSVKSRQLFLKHLYSINWGNKKMREYVYSLIQNNKEDWCLSRNRIFNSPLSFNPWNKKIFKNMLKDKWIGMDVWFDSANSIPISYNPPVDLVIEGIDQYKGYFLRSLQVNALLLDKPFTKKVISTGFIVDKNGMKLSKSKKNYDNEPEELLKKFTSDVIRVWAMQFPFYKDIKFSEEHLKESAQKIKKYKNFLTFIAGYFTKKRISLEILPEHDKWLLFKMNLLIVNFLRFVKIHKIQKSLQLLFDFLDDISAHYLSPIKLDIYTSSKSSLNYRSFTTSLSLILTNLIYLLSPFIPELIRDLNLSLLIVNDVNRINLIFFPNFKYIYNKWEKSLEFFKSLRNYSEEFLCENPKVKNHQLVLHYPFKINNLDNKSLNFFSNWYLKENISQKFDINDNKICNSCKRNIIEENKTFCQKCSKYIKS